MTQFAYQSSKLIFCSLDFCRLDPLFRLLFSFVIYNGILAKCICCWSNAAGEINISMECIFRNWINGFETQSESECNHCRTMHSCEKYFKVVQKWHASCIYLQFVAHWQYQTMQSNSTPFQPTTHKCLEILLYIPGRWTLILVRKTPHSRAEFFCHAIDFYSFFAAQKKKMSSEKVATLLLLFKPEENVKNIDKKMHSMPIALLLCSKYTQILSYIMHILTRPHSLKVSHGCMSYVSWSHEIYARVYNTYFVHFDYIEYLKNLPEKLTIDGSVRDLLSTDYKTCDSLASTAKILVYDVRTASWYHYK